MNEILKSLSPEIVEAYRRDGFVHIPNIISKVEANEFRCAALATAEKRKLRKNLGGNVFTQMVNVWREDNTTKRLTLHPNVAAIAEWLAGVPLRLWHDHTLIKQPHNNAATEFHQDQPYWPHGNSSNSLSAWIALCDVPVERGCMTFIPGSHYYGDLPKQNLVDPSSLMTICPDLQWEPRVTIPLQVGHCTFHHGRCAHMAGPNYTDEPRIAHAVIYMDATTTYDPIPHPVTDPLKLNPGVLLEGELFPKIGSAWQQPVVEVQRTIDC